MKLPEAFGLNPKIPLATGSFLGDEDNFRPLEANACNNSSIRFHMELIAALWPTMVDMAEV